MSPTHEDIEQPRLNQRLHRHYRRVADAATHDARVLNTSCVLPVEFRVTGTPISHQSHNKELLASWRENVKAAARSAIPADWVPVGESVELHVVYYYEDGPVQIPDEDNLLKPIQDALIGVIYDDDDQVMDGTCRKRNIDGPFRVRNWSPVVAAGFVEGAEFVHIIVREAPDPEVLQT